MNIIHTLVCLAGKRVLILEEYITTDNEIIDGEEYEIDLVHRQTYRWIDNKCVKMLRTIKNPMV